VAPAARRQQVARQQLATRPEFRVLTVDGLSWIDPYDGAVVSAPFGFEDVALERLVERHPWESGAVPRPLPEVLAIRWAVHLRAQGDQEPRLRMATKDGRWLNPYSGALVPLPDGIAGNPGRLVDFVARELASYPGAAAATMKPRSELDAILDRAQREGTGVHVTKRSNAPGVTPAVTPRSTGDEDMDRARRMIDGLLPRPPALDGWSIAVHYQPHTHLGGDFFDFVPLPGGRLLIVLGDVAGHGIQACLAAVAAIKSLRLLARFHPVTTDLLTQWNEEVSRDLPRGSFVSAQVLVLEPATGRVAVYGCGAHPIVRLRQDHALPLERIGRNGPAFGVLAGGRFAASLMPVESTVEPGERLVLYTDGVSEAATAQGVEFGHHRVLGSLLMHADHGGDGIMDRVVEDVRRFTGRPPDDDLSMLVIGHP
jgi:hypothetical protein